MHVTNKVVLTIPVTLSPVATTHRYFHITVVLSYFRFLKISLLFILILKLK